MREEPEFISQTAEQMTPDERRMWCRKQARDAEEKGATFHRWTMHDEIPNLILYEGWKAKPEDQGDPRFQLVATTPGPGR